MYVLQNMTNHLTLTHYCCNNKHSPEDMKRGCGQVGGTQIKKETSSYGEVEIWQYKCLY